MAESAPALTVFGADWCSDCRRSKRLLDRLAVPYLYRDLEEEPAAAAEAEAISGRRSIPVVVLPDGRFLVEPPDSLLQGELVGAGLLPS